MASAADARPKCPVCGARVGDAAARDPGARRLENLVLRAEFQNPKNAAQAAEIRRKNARGAK